MIGTFHSVNNIIGKVTKENIELFLHQHSVIYSENCVEKNEEVEGYKKILNNPFKGGNGTGYMDNIDDREYANQDMKNLKKL